MSSQLKSYLSKPADISSIVVYRILFGLCMLVHAFVYNSPVNIMKLYAMPEFFFSFPVFQWMGLPILDDTGFYFLYTFMGLAAFCVMVGLFYRLSLIILLLTQMYASMLEKIIPA